MSPRRTPFALLSLLAASAALGACGPHGERDARSAERDAVREAADRAAALATGEAPGDSRPGARLELDMDKTGALVRGGDPPLGAGDVRVVSTDGALVLALVGDTVRMRLGDSVVTKVRRELDEGADSAAGLGGLISRTVKGAVGGAVAEATRFAVRVPVAEVRDLRYEDGELRFGSDRKRGTHTNARFTRADAERFIGAVQARQRALGVPVAGG